MAKQEAVHQTDSKRRIGIGKVVDYLGSKATIQELEDKIAKHGIAHLQVRKDKTGNSFALLRKKDDFD